MQIYLVGGAVRDQLLGLPVHERDWVVVGASPQMMLHLGYRPVGKDFPVFLHPETQEEYALARTERKIGPGYTGFSFYAAPEVTLEQDLVRRDLTINAMAMSAEDELIDLFGGQSDLAHKILKHVSLAFAEDPVRILRVARFAARFGDFKVHPETLQLMRDMVQQGEVDALVAERVWQELNRALAEPYPQRFFEVLTDCGALKILFPQINFSLTALRNSVETSSPLVVRFAVLLRHHSKAEIDKLCQDYRVPREYRDLAVLVAENLEKFKNLMSLDAVALLSLLESLDVFRRPERLQLFSKACLSILYPIDTNHHAMRLEQAYTLAKSVDATIFIQEGLQGAAIGAALRKKQVELISEKLGNRE